MRKILISSMMIAGFIVILPSCKKNYLETSPTDQVSQADIFKTTKNAWIAINGIHRLLYIQYNASQDQGGQSANMIYSDFMGEDLVSPTTANNWFISTYRWQAHRNENSTMDYFEFQFYYDIIANANMIIANIDGAVGPDADKKAIRGQALAYRAWSYFQMIQLFGKRYDKTTANDGLGLSIVIIPTREKIARSTVAQVYAQIITDINAAIADLGIAATRINASHINLNVAKGLKARIALAMQDWTTAAQMANEARTGFSLMTNAQYMQGFNNYTNSEWMWGSHQISEQGTFFYSFFAFMSADFNSSNIRTGPKCINSELYNFIAATDVRKQLWDPTGTNTAFPTPPGGARFPYMNRKFLSGGGSGSSIGDLPIMRVAEMYLIEAEARARAGGQDAAAANVLFTLAKNRDPSYVLSTNTGAALINEIMIQRRIELWGEGFRFYDLKRLNLPLVRAFNHVPAVASILSVPVGDKLWEFLIPRLELNTNSNSVQNPL
jgi:starch-binding outer membrane protein, SusD/RagB family